MKREVFRKVIFIEPHEKESMQKVLDFEEGHAEDYGRDSVIETFSTVFDTPYKKYGVDIKVCNGDTPYVDPVLFEVVEHENVNHWHEIYPLDVDDTLEGEYVFEDELEDEGVEVVLEVLVISENSVNKTQLGLSKVPLEEVQKSIQNLNFELVGEEPIEFTLEMRDKKSTSYGTKFNYAQRNSDIELALTFYHNSKGMMVASEHKGRGKVFAGIVEQLEVDNEGVDVSLEVPF